MTNKSKVKAHYRKGKLVKSYNKRKKVNARDVINMGLTLGSLALIPYSGYRIVKNAIKLRKMSKDIKKVNNVVRETKKMSKNIPKMEVEVPKEVKETLSNLTSNIKKTYDLKYRGNLKVKGLKGRKENSERIRKRLDRISNELDSSGYGSMFRTKPLNQYDRKTRKRIANQVKKSANVARDRANANLDLILDKDTGYNSYLNLITFKKPKQEKNVKVKSFTRRGKLVRSFNRKQKVNSNELKNKILTGLGGAAVGAGLVGAGVLIGRGKKPQIIQQVVNADDIAKQVISKMPKRPDPSNINPDYIVSKIKEEVSKQKEEINNIVEQKLKGIQTNITSNVDEDKIISAVSKAVEKQKDDINTLINNKLNNLSIAGGGTIFGTANISSGMPKEYFYELPEVKLPKDIYNLSDKKKEELAELTLNMTDDELHESSARIWNKLEKYTKSEKQIGIIKKFNRHIQNFKEGGIGWLSEKGENILESGNRDNINNIYSIKEKREKELLKELQEELGLEDLFPTTKSIQKAINSNMEIKYNKEYSEKLSKFLKRNREEYYIYREEITKRRNKIERTYESKEVTDESELKRITDLVNQEQDDKYGFKQHNNTVNFRRPRGAKDKEQRKRRIKGYAYMGLAGSIGSTLLGTGSLLGAANYYHRKYPTDSIEQILKPRPKNIKSKIGMIGLGGALLGGTLGVRSVYLEHKNSPYSPIGKKEWTYKSYIK